jgi:hypothetical protein
MNAKPADRETVTFDYGIPAELFMGKRKGGARQPLRYRRFATAAEAIRFAIEELPAVRALGAWMQVGDQRFDGDDIQRPLREQGLPTATASVGLNCERAVGQFDCGGGFPRF